MSFELMTDIFFRILNFGIFGALCIYVIRTQVVPALKKTQQQEIEDQKIIEQTTRDLSTRREQEIELHQLQQKLFQTLLSKQQHWQNMVRLQQVAAREQQNKVHVKMEKKVALQQEAHDFNQATKKVLPRAVDQAQVQLQEKFSNPKEAQQYLDAIIAHLDVAESA